MVDLIYLYGPPGAGKSSFGRALADDLGLRFVDLDQVIVRNAGMSISEIFANQGELSFRDRETATLKAVADEGSCVVALGGGALLRDENRQIAESTGSVVLLMEDTNTLLERLQSDEDKRPLLNGNLQAKLTNLMEERREHYNSFANRLCMDGMSMDQAIHRTRTLLGHFQLRGMGKYEVVVKDNSTKRMGEYLIERGIKNPVLVTDENVAGHHAEKVLTSLQEFDPGLITIPAGESHKNLETVNRLWSGFLKNGMDRTSTIIALGGGVVSDLAGFAASTYMRGVDWVVVPTTLLAMADASIGGKTGFDLPEGKNLIGSFYPPRLVIADPENLKTLPEDELRSGLAEVVKHGILADRVLFEMCASGLDLVKRRLVEIVKRAVAVKVQIVERDPYEIEYRAALNLGHTVGHAIELVSGFQIRHGEAVAIGMVVEARYAERIHVAGYGLSDAIATTLAGLGLPVEIPDHLSREKLLHAMQLDKKKTGGVVRFSLPVDIGEVKTGIEVKNLEEVL